ncbi:unnamed protein product, partial [Meganyctiphanes norvegica]
CEDCGCKWTTTLAEVPVTIFIKDIDDYYKKLSNNLLEEVKPPMVLCVFRPSDRDIWDTAITLSCVAPRQNSPYNWRINHKQNGPAAASGCQIIPLRGNDLERRNEDNNPDQEMATIKPSKSENINPKEEIDIIKEEIDDENEEMIQDDSLGLLADEKKLKSDNDSKTVSEPGRFHRSTILDIQSVSEKRLVLVPKTKKQTTWGIGIFTAWLQERNKMRDFEHLSPAALDELLSTFYVEARQVSGEPYSKSGLRCIRAAIQRYLQGEPWNRTIVITKDHEFFCSNKILCGILKNMSAEGRDKTSHHPVESDDLIKLSESGVIGTDNPKSLQRLVWLSLALHFGHKRGAEGWRRMNKSTFVHSFDDEGKAILLYRNYEKQKNHQEDVNVASCSPETRVYARPGNRLCPVKAFNKYLSLLHPELDALWQRPNDKWQPKEDCYWYSRIPLGEKSLNSMLKKMSIEAGLSKVYTNHCLHVAANISCDKGKKCEKFRSLC